MTRQELQRIIEEEQLINVNWFDEENLRPNQVGISNCDQGYRIYVTDERASIVEGSQICYADESDAYEAVLKKLRYGKKKFY